MISQLKYRSLEEIQQTIYQHLQADRAGLFDASPGSILYSITRAMATIHADFDLRLGDLISQANLITASGEALDSWAALYGFTRKSGAIAKGSVIVTSLSLSNLSLSDITLLIEPETYLQYRLVNSSTTTIRNDRLYTLAIEATDEGVRFNLPGGTSLIAPGYPDLFFKVGTHVLEDGSYCGTVSGGIDKESDIELKNRILSKLQYGVTGNSFSIRSYLLTNPLINWVSFEQIGTNRGLLRCWVTSAFSLEPSLLNDLATTVKEYYLPAGYNCEIVQALPVGIDIYMEVIPYTSDNLNMNWLKDNVIAITKDYFYSLDYGMTFEPLLLAARVKNEMQLLRVTVHKPTAPVSPMEGEAFIVQDLDIRIDVL